MAAVAVAVAVASTALLVVAIAVAIFIATVPVPALVVHGVVHDCDTIDIEMSMNVDINSVRIDFDVIAGRHVRREHSFRVTETQCIDPCVFGARGISRKGRCLRRIENIPP